MLRQCEQAKRYTERDIVFSSRRLSSAIRPGFDTEFNIL